MICVRLLPLSISFDVIFLMLSKLDSGCLRTLEGSQLLVALKQVLVPVMHIFCRDDLIPSLKAM
ncbi:hypothetical protein M758_10G065200 [Ceratodon purpureus]|nr:hypothetical protein M758_10G065200 [Ceratodon purpureus]